MNESTMTLSMGGEVAEEVKRLEKSGTIRCRGICFKDTPTTDIRGYPHDGGIPDAQGKKWWVYVHCNNPVTRDEKRGKCDYQTSWGKIQ